MDRALSGATTQGQSGPGSNGKEGALRNPQGPSITGTIRLFSVISGHSLGVGSAEKQSMYSTAPADWAINKCEETDKH